MSKFKNFLLVSFTFGLDALIAYMWYIVLFSTEPATTFEIVIATVMLTFVTVCIIGFNWAVFMTSLAEDS